MGTIDTSIYSQYKAPSPIDFTRLAQLAMGREELDMNKAAKQVELQQLMTNQSRQTRMREILETTPPDQVQSALLKEGFLDESGKVNDLSLKTQTGAIAKQKHVHEMIKQAVTSVMADPTENTAIRTLDQLEGMTGQKMDEEKAAVYSFRNDPNALRKWAAGHAMEASKLTPSIENIDLGGKSIRSIVNPVTGQVEQQNSQAKTMSPGEIARNQIQREQLGIQRQQLALNADKLNRDSTAQQKLNMKMDQDAKKAALLDRSSSDSADIAIGKVDEALSGLSSTTSGLVGKVGSFIPGTKAYDQDKVIETLKSRTGFDALQAMRQASPTGGALGQVAVRELDLLQSSIASLDIGQSKEKQLSNLNQIRKHYENWKSTLGGANPQETTQFNSMPDPAQYSGRKIKADDGTIYTSNGSKWMRNK